MVTLKDIAKEAGVSITTVSNVINGKSGRVSAQTVERIQSIIGRENYVPSMSARALVSKSSNIICMINHSVPRRAGSFLSDPFHSTLIAGVEERIRERGYFLMLRTVEDARGLEKMSRNWNPDGLMLAGLFEDDFFEAVNNLGIPFVLLDSYINNPKIYNVGLEDFYGAHLATKHLLEKGHRQIAFASPFIKPGGVVEQRLLGYKKALGEYMVPFDQKKVFEQEISPEDGFRLGVRLSQKKHITAIFATADILAAGILTGLREEGVDVPGEKSIIGFDDNYLCRFTSPKLTTVHQDAEEKGILACEMLFGQLEERHCANRRVVLPVRLVERESVATLSHTPRA